MRAAPMTKGTIGRDLILEVMQGQFAYAHPTARYSTEKRKKSVPSSKFSPITEERDDES